jgi:hypothetical protein
VKLVAGGAPGQGYHRSSTGDVLAVRVANCGRDLRLHADTSINPYSEDKSKGTDHVDNHSATSVAPDMDGCTGP